MYFIFIETNDQLNHEAIGKAYFKIILGLGIIGGVGFIGEDYKRKSDDPADFAFSFVQISSNQNEALEYYGWASYVHGNRLSKKNSYI